MSNPAVLTSPTTGLIVLFEGDGGTKDIVRAYTDKSGQDVRVKPNDSARSLKLLSVREECHICIFDDAEGSTGDDFCVIHVKKRHPEYVVPSFEKSYEDDYVKVTFAERDGLDGCVSRIRIQ